MLVDPSVTEDILKIKYFFPVIDYRLEGNKRCLNNISLKPFKIVASVDKVIGYYSQC